MIFGMSPEALVFLACFLGTLARTIIPFLGKLKADPTIKFETKYVITFYIAIFESFIIAILSLSAIPPALLESGLSSLFMFGGVFGWAYSTNDLFNRIVSAQAVTVLVEPEVKQP